MPTLTQTQLAIQKQLEQQLISLYQLDQRLDAIQQPQHNSKSHDLAQLEQALKDHLREQSLQLTQHVARNELFTKEFIRLELELEQLQQSNALQQEKISTMQTSVATARRHHQFLQEQTQRLQQEESEIAKEHAELVETKNRIEQTLQEKQQECSSLQDEIDKLQERADFLQNNIDGLMQMRENNMLSVMDLTTRLNDVSSGKE